MAEEVRCQMCGKPNPADAEFCQYCHVKLVPISANVNLSKEDIDDDNIAKIIGQSKLSTEQQVQDTADLASSQTVDQNIELEQESIFPDNSEVNVHPELESLLEPLEDNAVDAEDINELIESAPEQASAKLVSVRKPFPVPDVAVSPLPSVRCATVPDG